MNRRTLNCHRRLVATRRSLFLEALEARFALDASLSGFVFIDVDGDGLRGPRDLGIPGTLVTLSGTDASGDAVSRSTLSHTDGSYAFHALEAGQYQLAERQPRAFVDGLDATSVPGAVTNNDAFSNLVLADGQHFAENNFGERYLRAEFVDIRWLFASAPPLHELMREAVAHGEEMAGDAALASEIRAGGTEAPDDTNAPPVAMGDAYEVDNDQVLNVLPSSGVLANDSDPDGDSLTAQLVAPPTHGTLSLNPDGALVYTPSGDFQGVDSFTYRASDGASVSSTATVTITVSQVPDVPEQALPDFTLTDVNPHSATHNQGVSPRDYLEQVSGWYFGHST